MLLGKKGVFHLPEDFGYSGWKVNVTRLFVSFQWKIAGSNRTSENVVLFLCWKLFRWKIRVPFTNFTSSRLFAGISLILACKIVQERSLGTNGTCVKWNKWNTFLTRWKFPAKFSGFFSVTGKCPRCHPQCSSSFTFSPQTPPTSGCFPHVLVFQSEFNKRTIVDNAPPIPVQIHEVSHNLRKQLLFSW